MRRMLLAFILLLAGCAGDRLHAQNGPNENTPGWLQPITTDPGNTRYGWNAVQQTAPLPVQSSYLYNNITTDTTTTVKSGAGVLHTVCINTPAATETITIYDNTAASGTKIGTATLFASTNPCFVYDVVFTTGLTIVTATAAGDITVSYR